MAASLVVRLRSVRWRRGAHEERVAVLPVDVERGARRGARARGAPARPTTRRGTSRARCPAASSTQTSSTTAWPRSRKLSFGARLACARRASGARARRRRAPPRRRRRPARGTSPPAQATARAGEGAHADHQQVERARHELDDHQHEARDDPGEIRFHGVLSSNGGCGGPILRAMRARRVRRGAWRRSPWCSRPPSPARRRAGRARSSRSGPRPLPGPRPRPCGAPRRSTTPSCIHSTLAPMAMASSAMAGISSLLRKQSTMSTGSGMSRSDL